MNRQQIKYELDHRIYKHPYKIPSEVLDYLDPTRYVLRENFALRPGLNANRDVPAGDTYNTAQMQLGIDKNPNFEVLGTNATSALVTHSTSGGLTLTTAGASGDQIIILPHLNSAVSAWNVTQWSTDKSITFETVIVTGANITAATIWAGFKLTNTSVVATDDDQVFFRYQDTQNSGKWQIIHSRGGTDTTTNTSLTAVAVSTKYRLRLALNSARQPRFWINDQEVLYNGLGSVFPALTASVNLIPYVGVQAGAAAAKAIDLRGLICSRV